MTSRFPSVYSRAPAAPSSPISRAPAAPGPGPRAPGAPLKVLFVVALASVFVFLTVPGQTQKSAGPEYIDGRFWVDLEPPVSSEGEEYPLSEDTAIELLLEEARYVFSAMLYGFRFRYVPSDNGRRIEEEFELEAISMVERGDERLSVLSTRVEDLRLYAQLEYRLADFQRSRLAGWESNRVESVGAEGEAPFWQGHGARIPAIEDAIRRAVRGLLQTMTDNKPREARGSVLLLEAPRIYIRSGGYRARVNVKVKVDDIRPYEVY